MNLVVDRIEGKIAVCEQEDMKMINIPLADLPDDIHEGSILKIIDGAYIIDTVAEAERMEKLRALKNSIFNE